jgi:hypothetical protein
MTDSTGQFQLSGLDAGPLSLTAQKKSYLVDTRTVSADAADDLVIEMTRGDGLDVTGQDGILGTSLGSFSAQVFDGTGTKLATSYVSLDSSGRGEIPSLQARIRSLRARAGTRPPLTMALPSRDPASR